MADQQPIIIEHHARGATGGPGGRKPNVLRARRWSISAGLALIEILYILIARHSWVLSFIVALLILLAATFAIRRLRPGIVRDALMIVAISQAFVMFIPLALTASFALALILAILVIVGLLVVAFRLGA